MTTAIDSRMAHLQMANEVRHLRAELKAGLAAGRVGLAETLRAEHDWLHTMKVASLLRAIPTLGPVRSARLLTALRLPPSQTVGRLNPHRREQLIACLEERHPKACSALAQSERSRTA